MCPEGDKSEFYRTYRSVALCREDYNAVIAHNRLLTNSFSGRACKAVVARYDDLCDNKRDQWFESVRRFRPDARGVGPRALTKKEAQDTSPLTPSGFRFEFGSRRHSAVTRVPERDLFSKVAPSSDLLFF